MKIKRKIITLVMAVSFLVYGSGALAKDSINDNDMSGAGAGIELVDSELLKASVTKQSRYKVEGDSLKVTFDSMSAQEGSASPPSMMFKPTGSFNGRFDWNAQGGLRLDVENPESQALTVEFKVSDASGVTGDEAHQLSYELEIPAKTKREVAFLFNGAAMKIKGYQGGSQLDLANIAAFTVSAIDAMNQQTGLLHTLVLHDIEFIKRTGDFVVTEARSGQVVKGELETLHVVSDFDEGIDDLVVTHSGSDIVLVDSKQGQSLNVHYQKEQDYPSVVFSAGKEGETWDWSTFGDVAFAFDASNKNENGIQLFVRIDDALDEKQGGSANGAINSRTGYVQLAPNSSGKYYFTFKALDKGMESGMRGEPPEKAFSATQVVFAWGEEALDLSHISSVRFYMTNPKQDATIVIDNLSLIPNLSTDKSRYTDLLDEFGQYVEESWKEKITSVEQLQAQASTDKTLIKNAKLMEDRSQYSGWKQGPKLEATGYFRTEKLDGKWTLVDPDGYLYFVTGLDNMRMDDSYTVTGIDFKEAKAVNNAHMRPSQIQASDYAEDGRERMTASPLRRNMFTWLPDYSDPLADNYSYTQMIHKGPLKHGEVFSFYSANLQRKYNTETSEEAISIWKAVTLARMLDWGFTSLGNWSDPMYRKNEKVPYTAHGWIVGDHQRVETGNDYWGAMHDPFDPEFTTSVATMAKEIGEEVDNDPWCIGYFVDNELSWGNTMSEVNHYSLAVSALRASSDSSASKVVFDNLLKNKYSSIEQFNKAWNTEVDSWETFAKGFDFQGEYTEVVKQDLGSMLFALADQYFKVVSEEMAKQLPNHLFLGSRFSDWGITPEATQAAAQHVDVMSYNLYAKDLHSKGDWSRLAKLDMPSMIGEFHFGSLDSGLFHPGIISADDQQDRADAYVNYMESIIENPYFIGAHWFQYMDSPVTGRAWDGENYNVGFVTVADVPYEPLVNAAKKVNETLYEKRFNAK